MLCPQRYQRTDGRARITFGAGQARAQGTAGIYADQHAAIITLC
jgi:hypothetical protein